MVKIKRVYEERARNDGFRILIDRLWPRGLSKAKAHVDLWLKDIAPTTLLRKWFGHDPKRWKEFQKRYRAELKQHQDAILLLKHLIKEKKQVTLLYGARDEQYNNAVALKKILKF
ncbi:MAG TPA: DUF488 family protein [Candidatus Babeliales bacterium]|nr:DUF488 family protein [Candidatus Babeliales bacterium]